MISLICKKYSIENYTINDDGSIDVNGYVDLYDKKLTELPLVFNKVTGDFDCGGNQLTSLKGCPRWVGGYFSCRDNQLTSLEFVPDYVGDDFFCGENDLIDNLCDTEIGAYFYTTLRQDGLIFDGNRVTNYTNNDDGSIDVNGDVDLYDKKLTELPLTFNKVSGYFSCSSNQLTNNLCDTEIGGSFYTTLKQDGLIIDGYNKATNYNEWRKLYKRKKILNDIFNM